MTAAAGERLNRFLARRGVASRRHADELIAAGRVSIDGAVATLGARVHAGRTVTVDGAIVPAVPPPPVTLALNKPAGVVTTMADPQGRPVVRDLVPDIPGLVPIGRLDADSRGLLLLTSDGDLAHRVAHPRHHVDKVYRVVPGAPLRNAQLQAMVAGVELEDGPAAALAVRRVAGTATIEVVMGEGRKRLVRRLVAAVGGAVDDLCRVAIGPVRLGSLAEGRSRRLRDEEVAALREAAARAGEPAR